MTSLAPPDRSNERSGPGSPFAVLLPVGPGDLEKSRLIDLLSSLFHYEDQCRVAILISDRDDSLLPGIQELLPSECHVEELKNPRQKKGEGWSDGLSTATLAGLRHLAREEELEERRWPRCEFAVRLDTDSLIVGPFARQVGEFLDGHPEVGLAGTFRAYPSGEARVKDHVKPMLDGWIQPATLLRSLPRLLRQEVSVANLGHTLRRRGLLAKAERNGYRRGEYIQGGGYAIAGTLWRRLREVPEADDPLLFLFSKVGEDVSATVLCYACGLRAADFNRPGEVFGVVSVGLPDTPAALEASGYAVIHSVKTAERQREEDIREYFRGRRHASIR